MEIAKKVLNFIEGVLLLITVAFSMYYWIKDIPVDPLFSAVGWVCAFLNFMRSKK